MVKTVLGVRTVDMSKYMSKRYATYCPNFPPRPLAEVQAEERDRKRKQSLLEREQAAEIRAKLAEKGFSQSTLAGGFVGAMEARGADVTELDKDVEKMAAFEALRSK